MSKILTITASIILIVSCKNLNHRVDTHVMYLGESFSLPDTPRLIAQFGGDDTQLIIRYGDTIGKRYISLSSFHEEIIQGSDCKPSEFVKTIFSDSNQKNCSEEQIIAFRKLFIENRQTGKWKDDRLTSYYSISSDASFLFIIYNDDKTIKLESDFLNKEQLIHMIEPR